MSLLTSTSAPVVTREEINQFSKQYMKKLSDRFLETQAGKGYVKGQPLVSADELNKLPWEMMFFHEWYKHAVLKKLDFITAYVPAEVYHSVEGYLMLSFEDLHAMFHQQKLDINLISLWCL